MKITTKVWFFFKCLLGFGSIDDGSICWWDRNFSITMHDYPITKGGDGYATHFHEYKCRKCGKKFSI